MRALEDLRWIAWTVFMEAGRESFEGKLAVAWVIVNRAVRAGRTISDTVLEGWQFSAWNTTDPGRLRLDEMSRDDEQACVKAAAGAYFNLRENPAPGATHYLNPELTLKIRKGTFPLWAAAPGRPDQIDQSKAVAHIGRHLFMKI